MSTFVQLICSYLFWPLAYVMGIRYDDCRTVAQLIGIKIFLNEFLAFKMLGQLIDNQKVASDYVNYMNATKNNISLLNGSAPLGLLQLMNGTYNCSGNTLHLLQSNATLVGGFISVSLFKRLSNL